MQAGKQRASLPLMRRFNEHSEKLLKASDSASARCDFTCGSFDDAAAVVLNRNVPLPLREGLARPPHRTPAPTSGLPNDLGLTSPARTGTRRALPRLTCPSSTLPRHRRRSASISTWGTGEDSLRAAVAVRVLRQGKGMARRATVNGNERRTRRLKSPPKSRTAFEAGEQCSTRCVSPSLSRAPPLFLFAN